MARTIDDWGRSYPLAPGPDAVWPLGNSWVGVGRLRQALAFSARAQSRTAVRQYVSSDRDELLHAAMAVGTASELLLKALVHHTSPALLADRGDRDSLLLLAGVTAPAVDPLRFRSISALEVHRLAKHLHPALPVDVRQPEALTARNAAAHLGIVDPTQLRRAVTQHAVLVGGVLPLLNLDADAFWGADLMPSAAALVDRARSDTARIVASKLASARTALRARIRALPEAAQAAYLAALSGRKRTFTEREEPHACPACEQQGWLLCTVERGPVEPDLFDEGRRYREVTAYPFAFECNVCGLELEDDELSEFADIPVEIELESEDVEE
ncbi:hypothetical protein [Microbacterium phyllosphaerae]|uniref:hypothetical protein n=1 Tax=Microbacterium phyllosphaerae TaxID=124798 RepID=UPI003D6610C1